MEARQLEAERRTETGKGVARKLRAQGKIPAICYGKNLKAIPMALVPGELAKVLDREKGVNTLIKLDIKGEEPMEKLVLVKDRQFHPLSGSLLHADFVEVKEGEVLRIEVPLILTGRSKGVKEGGTLSQPRRRLLIECTPDKIPTKIELDVTNLDLGDSIHIDELEMPDGVKAVYDRSYTVAVVVAPSAEKEEKVEEEAAAEEEKEGEAEAGTGEETKKPEKEEKSH
ncbi:MAG: 50S ribosomal protein L25/general stress protein Ctc [Deltaproteobacteria bacterium]|nr:50S ribosomal protein L25/general stress protein Ctc [Deltaproteobacteria bacterium]